MKKEKNRYYLSVYIMSFAFILILTIISHINGEYLISGNLEMNGIFAEEFEIFLYKDKTFVTGKYIIDIVSIFIFPFLFLFMFWLIDVVLKLLKGKKKRQAEIEQMKYDEFIKNISREMNASDAFNVEDYRHFRENAKFQETLKRFYSIYQEGENANISYSLLERKFNKGSKEREAVTFLIPYVKKLREEKLANETPNEKEEKDE